MILILLDLSGSSSSGERGESIRILQLVRLRIEDFDGRCLHREPLGLAEQVEIDKRVAEFLPELRA
jgi:hypothetical protein